MERRPLRGRCQRPGINLNISPLIIGLTIVSFGTSAPEILVSVMASLQGNTGLAIGNAIGSNITNTTLILGITALAVPLSVKSSILRRELPVLILLRRSPCYCCSMAHSGVWTVQYWYQAWA